MIIKRTKIQPSVLISIFLMLYMSRDTVLFGTNGNGIMKLVGYVAYGGIALYWMLKGKVAKKLFDVALFFIALGGITLITTGVNIKIFYLFLLVVLAAFFCSNVKFEVFAEAYQKIMLFLSIYSIVAYALYEIAYPIVMRFPIFRNEANVAFINLFFDMPMVKVPYVEHRSFGIFREPGVYMIFLTLALMFELFFVKNESNKKTVAHIVIYVIALVLTLSTAGFIVMALVLILYLFFGSNNQNHKNLKMVVFIAFFVGALWLLFDKTMFEVVFGKLMSDNYSKASRMESVYSNIRMITDNIEHFFTGLGFSFVEENFSYYSTDSSMGDNTNTIFRVFSTYGFLYISVLMALWFKFFAKLKNAFVVLCLFGTFCLCLFNESLIVNVMLYIIAFYSLNTDLVVKKEILESDHLV